MSEPSQAPHANGDPATRGLTPAVPSRPHPTSDPADRLLVSEIFGPTIQGEGPAAGRRAIFIRLAGCPVGCTWCDTRYSWDPHAQDDQRPKTVRLVEDITSEVIDRAGNTNTIVVITGGEPLAQARALNPLVTQLRSSGRPVHLETAGVHDVSPTLLDQFELIVVSPKLSNAGPQAAAALSRPALRNLARHDNTWFKFVITNLSDLAEIAGLVKDIETNNVMVMAEGADPTRSLQLSRSIVDDVVSHGWSLSPRLHIWLWGDQPGR